MRMKGAIFCQERRIKTSVQAKPSIIKGTQKWNGAEPNFKAKLKIIKGFVKEKEEEKKNEERKIVLIRIAEAKAWTKKYFKVASALRGDLFSINKVRRASMLISRPIHAIIQEGAEIAIKVPENKIKKNKIFQGRIRIKRRTLSIFGIWAQKLLLAYSFVFWCKEHGKFWSFRYWFKH